MSTAVPDTIAATAQPPKHANPYGHPLPIDKFTPPRTCTRTHEQIVLAYQTTGDPTDPCLLLVSGLSCTCYRYEEAVVRQLAQEGFFVVRMDNRDVGLSTHMTGYAPPNIVRMVLPAWISIGEGQAPYFIEDLAADAFHVLDSLKIEKAHLMGESMGGMIIQSMAIAKPERVLSLNIVYSHTGGKVWPQTPRMSLACLAHPKSDKLEDLVDFRMWHMTLFRGDYEYKDTPERREVVRVELQRARQSSRAIVRQMWCIQRSPSREAGLRALKDSPHAFPITIFHGMQDTMVPKENGFRLAEMMPQAKLVLFPRMGHLIPPVLFTDFVKELVIARELSQGGAARK